MSKNNGVLVLETGVIFKGNLFGFVKDTFGEVVFNTSLVGYEEVITDPSYKGQIVVMTYPHIGNYGINFEDMESEHIFIEGFVIGEYSKNYSNWRARNTLENVFIKNKIVGIENVDTRSLTRYIRDNGSMTGMITLIKDYSEIKNLIKKVIKYPKIRELDLVKTVSCVKTYNPFSKLKKDCKFKENVFHRYPKKTEFKVVIIDCGCKYNILRLLREHKCEIIVVPAETRSEKILSYKPDGIILSNGPGDPQMVSYVFKTVKQIIDYEQKTKDLIPIFGICLGHQMLAIAFGGKTYKLKFGHHGTNHPVKNLQTNKIEITSQNHNFVVKYTMVDNKYFLDGNNEVEITHLNLNDGSCEGLKHTKLPIFSVQYHPESAPGPNDSRYLFDQFLSFMYRYKYKEKFHIAKK